MKLFTLLLAAFCMVQSSFSAPPNILCNLAVATPGLQLVTAADLKSFWPTTTEHCRKACSRGQLLSSTDVEARSHL